MLRGLKADHMMDELGVAAPSLLNVPKDHKVEKRTMEHAEETRRKLAGINLDHYRSESLSGTILMLQVRKSLGEVRASIKGEGYQIEHPATVKSTTLFQSLAPVANIATIAEPTSFPSMYAPVLTGINGVVQNTTALESVQSFHSALSHLDHTLQDKPCHISPTTCLAGPSNPTSIGSALKSQLSETDDIRLLRFEDILMTEDYKKGNITIFVHDHKYRSRSKNYYSVSPTTKLSNVLRPVPC